MLLLPCDFFLLDLLNYGMLVVVVVDLHSVRLLCFGVLFFSRLGLQVFLFEIVYLVRPPSVSLFYLCLKLFLDTLDSLLHLLDLPQSYSFPFGVVLLDFKESIFGSLASHAPF